MFRAKILVRFADFFTNAQLPELLGSCSELRALLALLLALGRVGFVVCQGKQGEVCHNVKHSLGVAPNEGYLYGVPNCKDYSILGSVLVSPYCGTLPHESRAKASDRNLDMK